MSDAPAAVVLAHGLCASMDEPEFHATVGFVGECGYSTVSYDSRGHGTSGGESTLVTRSDSTWPPPSNERRRCTSGWWSWARPWVRSPSSAAATDADLAGVITISCPDRWKLPRTVRAVLAASSRAALVDGSPTGTWGRIGPGGPLRHHPSSWPARAVALRRGPRKPTTSSAGGGRPPRQGRTQPRHQAPRAGHGPRLRPGGAPHAATHDRLVPRPARTFGWSRALSPPSADGSLVPPPGQAHETGRVGDHPR